MNFLSRQYSHEITAPWFDQIGKITIEHFGGATELAAAERSAIEKENPKFNIDRPKATANPAKPKKPFAVYKYTESGLIKIENGRSLFYKCLLPVSNLRNNHNVSDAAIKKIRTTKVAPFSLYTTGGPRSLLYDLTEADEHFIKADKICSL